MTSCVDLLVFERMLVRFHAGWDDAFDTLENQFSQGTRDCRRLRNRNNGSRF